MKINMKNKITPNFSTIIKRFLLAFVLAAVMTRGIFPGPQNDGSQPQHDKLQYEVSVSVKLVPFFAFDKDNNPVYDLKEDEIELYINKRKTGFSAFHRYRVEEQQPAKPGTAQTNAVPAKKPERLNVIIIDNLISNINTLNPARAVAADIIKNASPGDQFIILESNQLTGLQYVAGPDKNKPRLFAALKKIKQRYIRRGLVRPVRKSIRSGGGHQAALDGILFLIALEKFKRQRERYQADISLFKNSVHRIKYALRTIKKPKNVYLISAPPNSTGMGHKHVTQHRILEEAAKSINYGGAMLTIINPLPYRDNNKRQKNRAHALRFMSDIVDGQYIAGTNFKDITTKLTRSTSAYYEVAFLPQEYRKKNHIEIKCKRKGVRIASISYDESPTPYRQMTGLEKKLFALDVVNRGTWSRLTGPVGVLPLKPLEKSSTKKLKRFQVAIPKTLRNRQVDIFLLNLDPATMKSQSQLITKKAEKIETLEIPVLENHRQCVVVIEPTHPVSLFNILAKQ